MGRCTCGAPLVEYWEGMPTVCWSSAYGPSNCEMQKQRRRPHRPSPSTSDQRRRWIAYIRRVHRQMKEA